MSHEQDAMMRERMRCEGEAMGLDKLQLTQRSQAGREGQAGRADRVAAPSAQRSDSMW